MSEGEDGSSISGKRKGVENAPSRSSVLPGDEISGNVNPVSGMQRLPNPLPLDKLCKICVIILLGIEITGSDMLLLV